MDHTLAEALAPNKAKSGLEAVADRNFLEMLREKIKAGVEKPEGQRVPGKALACSSVLTPEIPDLLTPAFA
jgi:hypothetical protein